MTDQFGFQSNSFSKTPPERVFIRTTSQVGVLNVQSSYLSNCSLTQLLFKVLCDLVDALRSDSSIVHDHVRYTHEISVVGISRKEIFTVEIPLSVPIHLDLGVPVFNIGVLERCSLNPEHGWFDRDRKCL